MYPLQLTNYTVWFTMHVLQFVRNVLQLTRYVHVLLGTTYPRQNGNSPSSHSASGKTYLDRRKAGICLTSRQERQDTSFHKQYKHLWPNLCADQDTVIQEHATAAITASLYKHTCMQPWTLAWQPAPTSKQLDEYIY